MKNRKETIESELITLRRHEASENFRDSQRANQAYYAEYGHCISDVEHLSTEDKEALQQKRLKKLRQEKVEWPSDDEILAELKLPKPAPEDD